MEKSVVKNGKELRYGLTTGSCATAAATSALEILLSKQNIKEVKIILPKGEEVYFQLKDVEIGEDFVQVTVIKDGGDDPDVTHGTEIVAKVSLCPKDIIIDGGIGVGRITKEGLKGKVGEAAINPVPRQMIEKNLTTVMNKHGYRGGAKVIISVPDGENLAKSTYNPRLGIIGGISILGTTGIVEPMSEKAIVDTNKVLIDKRFSQDNEIILISPGNYGRDFCKEYLNIDISKSIPISNFVGETLDYIKYKGFKKIIFVGHIGKIIKCAGGIMNTHSYYADCRMELMAVNCALEGAPIETLNKLIECISTDQALDIIKDEPYFNNFKKRIMDRIMYHLNFRLKNQVEIGVVMFSSDRNQIFKSENADALIAEFISRENLRDSE